MASKLEELRKNLLGAGPQILPSPEISQATLRVNQPTNGSMNVSERATRFDSESHSQLADAVGKMFEPATLCQERWTELAKSIESLGDMTQWATKALEPMKVLYEQMQKLSDTFESMRAFEQQLATLATSFAPVKHLHGEVAQIIQSFHEQCAQLVKSFEPAKACKRRMTELTSAFDAANELQARFFDLSQRFRPLESDQSRQEHH